MRVAGYALEEKIRKLNGGLITMGTFHKKHFFTALLFLLLLLLPIGCSPAAPDEPGQVTVLLDWTPNTNYSGIYAAIEEGFYDEESLNVEVIEAPGSVVQMVAAGQAEFGISYQEEVTFARLSDLPVVSIGAIIQQNTSGFASLKERAIETPADFEGKSYGGWGSPVEEATIRALMEKYGANFEEVDIITTGEVDSLIVIEREADFAWIYYGWTGIEAELKGMELNFIELREEEPALDYYTPILISGEGLIADNPELIKRFMRATAKGYQLAAENPEEAARHLLTHAPELDEVLVMASQEWLADKYQADAEVWGLQEKETWEAYSQWLYDHNLIEKMPDVDEGFTNEFLR